MHQLVQSTQKLVCRVFVQSATSVEDICVSKKKKAAIGQWILSTY